MSQIYGVQKYNFTTALPYQNSTYYSNAKLEQLCAILTAYYSINTHIRHFDLR